VAGAADRGRDRLVLRFGCLRCGLKGGNGDGLVRLLWFGSGLCDLYHTVRATRLRHIVVVAGALPFVVVIVAWRHPFLA